MAMNHPPLVPFRIPFIARTEAEFASELASAPPPPSCGASLVVTANVAHIVELRRNPRFRQAYRHAWRATADGTPVYLYARLRGARLPERLTGSGCFAKLMPLLDAGRHRCVFVAPTNEVGELCRNWLLARGFSEDQVAVIVPEKGFETDAAKSAELASFIGSHAPTHVFFGVGAPKSEIWVDEHRELLGDCYALCVGAGLEFFVGVKSRGPEWMRSIGLEWLWRLGSEPRRLAYRYLVSSWAFLAAVRNDLAGRPIHGADSGA